MREGAKSHGGKIRKIALRLLPEIFFGLLTTGYFSVLYFTQTNKYHLDELVAYAVVCILGIVILAFVLWNGILSGTLFHDNAEHPLRFWAVFGIGFLLAVLCSFLPAGSWPILPVFVALTIFGNTVMGILGGGILLIIAVLAAGGSSILFFSYFINGIFGSVMFSKIEDGNRLLYPLLSSVTCLFLCETASTILVRNTRPYPELFLMPAINCLICSLLVTLCMKVFSDRVLYRNRAVYLELNDQENPVLKFYREEYKDEYRIAVHVSYFCERIAKTLDMDADALKCAGLYHKIYFTEDESLEECLRNEVSGFPFPRKTVEILEDYRIKKSGIRLPETAVLMASENVMQAMVAYLKQSEDSDYEKIVDYIFERFYKNKVFMKCGITVDEIHKMKKLFREEKLYYDFLR